MMTPTLRPFCWDDLDAFVDYSASVAEPDEPVPTVEATTAMLKTPGIDATRVVRVLDGPDGRIDGCALGIALPGMDCDVLMVNARMRPGVDTLTEDDLLREAEALALASRPDPTRPGAFQTMLRCDRPERIGPYERAGYVPERWFLTLERPLDGPVTEMPAPEGISIRKVDPAADAARLHRTIEESFRDHWNPISFSQEQLEHMMASPGTSPDMWLVAVAADGEPAGLCASEPRLERNAQFGCREGMVEILAVRRPYRGKGLGRALLTRGLAALQRAGLDRALLDVDSESPTGATSLYASVGFTEYRRSAAYRKPAS